MEYQVGTTVFNDWVIIREIGKGATGTVFEIKKKDTKVEIRAALKVIRIPRSQDDIKNAMITGMDQLSATSYFRGFVNEIQDEIKVMVLLKEHPNIVSYEDHCIIEHKDEIGWDILIKMELLTPLVEWMLNHSIDANTVLKLGKEISSALCFAAEHNLVHRDVKPGNIFVDSLGRFKLGDFGIARVIDKTTGGLSKKGTANYMAPEIYFGSSSSEYIQQIDVYSLGIVLYRILNKNRLPFYPPYPQPITYADQENALMQRMNGEALPEPCSGSSELKRVIMKACEYRPEDRFASMKEMHDALRMIGNTEDLLQEEQTITLDEEDTEKTIAFTPEKAKKKSSAKKWIIAAVVVALAATGGITTAKLISSKAPSADTVSDAEETGTKADEVKNTEVSEVERPEDITDEMTEAVEEKTEDSVVYTSKHMWEQDGEIYTVNDVHMKGFHCMSGNYADSMILYDNKIYLKKIFAEGEPFAQIIRMDLDGNNQEIITNNMQGNTKMCIYDGYLYYTYRNENGEKSGHRQNLETGEEEDLGAHIFRDGNDHLWVSTNGKGTVWSISEPCYKNIRKTDKIKGSMLGINGDKIYYMYQENDGTYTTCAYNAKTDKSSKIIMGMSAKSIIAGDGLYYKYVADGKTTLYRWDLNDKNKKESFDLGEFNLYMGGGFNEAGDRIFLTQFIPENGQNNTELWELFRTSGKMERIATWYNANAEAAAQEP